MEIEVPRDRSGSFEPLLIAKGQKRFEGFYEKIIAMSARGMTVREIQGFLLDQYKVDVSADFISTVTDSVLEAVVEWQNRPLEHSYPVVYFDALRVKERNVTIVRNEVSRSSCRLRASRSHFGTEHLTGKIRWRPAISVSAPSLCPQVAPTLRNP